MVDVQLEDTLNQRWKNDKSGFGFKMLQKMGWSEDKGLGKDETGIVTSIKIKKREVGLGLGGEEEIDAAGNKGWSSTVSSFNAVLDMLKDTYSSGVIEKKKRKTTKSISVGMKYKRIQESKDLSTKSTADLTAVLGTSRSTTSLVTSIVSSTSTQSLASSVSATHNFEDGEQTDDLRSNYCVKKSKKVKGDKKKKSSKDKESDS